MGIAAAGGRAGERHNGDLFVRGLNGGRALRTTKNTTHERLISKPAKYRHKTSPAHSVLCEHYHCDNSKPSAET